MPNTNSDAPAKGDSTGPRLCRVERVIRHPEAMTFRALCQRVLPPGARYLLLDLDRTVHLGINTGEMLGWELAAWRCYGPRGLDRLEPSRGHRRMVVDWSRPLASARFTYRGVRTWLAPGGQYLLWGKIASQLRWLERLGARVLGQPPIQHGQRAVQQTLMRLLAAEDADFTRELAERVWHRHRARQVITCEDLEWVRTQWPDVEVILTSASPEPSVEVAARMLGIETHVYSTPARINSGEAKIARLREMRPDMFDRDVITVGITDTQYGEDHCWAKYLNTVVDINSSWPFPELTPTGSPLREVHSAKVLTQEESERRAGGESEFFDACRATGKPPQRRPLREPGHSVLQD